MNQQHEKCNFELVTWFEPSIFQMISFFEFFGSAVSVKVSTNLSTFIARVVSLDKHINITVQ